MTYRPATFIYRQYGVPRSTLRAAAESGRVAWREVFDIDGINLMKVYAVEDVEKLLNGEGVSDER